MISILLAAFNGEKYIAEQIESLLNQSVQEFKLIIHDDGSTDDTFTIISSYAKKHPNKITVIQNEKNSGGAKYNFMKMMIDYKDDYIMLCDQDDVWLPEKIEKTLNKIKQLEGVYGTATPILVHTDLKVVDKDLQTISVSYRKDMLSDFSKTSLNSIIIQNTLTGCSAMYNRALAELIKKEPKYMIMHDWWLILVAAAFGKIDYILEPTILYRQHGENDIGAKKVKSIRYIFHEILLYKEMAQAVTNTYLQTKSFLDMYGDKLDDGQYNLVVDYISIPGLPRLDRIKVLMKHNSFKNGFRRKIAQMWIVLRERRVSG